MATYRASKGAERFPSASRDSLEGKAGLSSERRGIVSPEPEGVAGRLFPFHGAHPLGREAQIYLNSFAFYELPFLPRLSEVKASRVSTSYGGFFPLRIFLRRRAQFHYESHRGGGCLKKKQDCLGRSPGERWGRKAAERFRRLLDWLLIGRNEGFAVPSGLPLKEQGGFSVAFPFKVALLPRCCTGCLS